MECLALCANITIRESSFDLRPEAFVPVSYVVECLAIWARGHPGHQQTR